MPRLKQYDVTDTPLHESMTKEIKRDLGAYVTRSELCAYLKIGKNSELFREIPEYNISPGKKTYRASDVAAALLNHRARG